MEHPDTSSAQQGGFGSRSPLFLQTRDSRFRGNDSLDKIFLGKFSVSMIYDL